MSVIIIIIMIIITTNGKFENEKMLNLGLCKNYKIIGNWNKYGQSPLRQVVEVVIGFGSAGTTTFTGLTIFHLPNSMLFFNDVLDVLIKIHYLSFTAFGYLVCQTYY